jgi:DNA-binding response OmpR family regulator
MDVDMPVMDGYAATQAIRQWERAQGRPPVPIIALTAYARPEDAQRCLDAGCTAHLAKPVRKPHLIHALTTLGARRSATWGALAAPLAERIVVRVDRELEGVVPGVLENRRQDVRSLREALERADFATIQRLGHRMKGSGAGYGFEAITQIGERLERAGRDRRPEETRECVTELEAYLERVEIAHE